MRKSNAYIVSGVSIAKACAFMALLIISAFSASGMITSFETGTRLSSFAVNRDHKEIKGDLLYQFMGWENHYFTNEILNDSSPKLTNLFLGMSANINLDDPRSLLGRELPGFYSFDGQIIVAGEGTNYTNMPIESAPPLEIMKAEREASLQNLEDIPEPEKNPGAPSARWKDGVFVYFSHNRESYLPYLKGEKDPDRAYHSKINVTKIGDQLKKSLEARGIGTIVDKTDINNNLVKKGQDFSNSYVESRNVVKEAMAGNKELLYFFDIHRDAHRKKKTTKVINGKSYAKLAFVIGAEHPNFKKNQKLAEDLHKLLEKHYKGLSRGVILKQGIDTNGKFNQDLSANAILIEFGGVDNTFEELNRSADALADVFADYFWDAESVSGSSKEPADKQ